MPALDRSWRAGAELAGFRIRTVNTSRDNKGSIHDDDKAQQMGFEGGFVPGATVFGYMMRLMRENFGDAWLAASEFNGRLRAPTYEGVEVTVEGIVKEEPSQANGGYVTAELRVVDPRGTVTAFAVASCRVGAYD